MDTGIGLAQRCGYGKKTKKMMFDANAPKHELISRKVDDWYIYTCPLCPDYRRAYNPKTGAMKVECDKNNRNLHKGSYTKPGFDLPFNPN